MSRARAGLLALLVLLAAPAAQGADPAQPPVPAPGAGGERSGAELPRRCGVCHLDKAPPAPAGAIAFTPPPRSAGAGESGMCYSCHNGVVLDDRRGHWTGRHHPASGKVQCGSCHTPHLRDPKLRPFMRFESGSYGFCASCHPGRRPGDPGEHPAVAAEQGRPRDCGACHVVHQATGDGLIRETSAEGLCRPCHGENPSREGRGPGKASHPAGGKGPACLDCHRVHRTAGGKAMLDKAALDGRLCRTCHDRAFSSGRGEPNHPVKADEATCFSCHRMHNADRQTGRKGLLAVPWPEVEKICRGCHAARAAGTAGATDWNHPLGGAAAGKEGGLGIRLAQRGAYFLPGGKVTCLSCHRAHGGAAGTPQLVTGKEGLCLYCHPEQNALDPELSAVGAHPVSVRPRRARIDEAFLRAGGETGRGGEITCVTCHRAHRARPGTPGLVLGPDSYSCLLCHKDQASIASTPHGSARAPAAAAEEAPGLCNGCHGEHRWRITIPPPAEGDGSSAIERLCGVCHGAAGGARFGGVTNHPTGAPLPPGRGPAGLPLFWQDGRRYRQGAMTCATCHDVHRNGPAGHLLRESVSAGGRDLCLGCHGERGTVAGTRHDLSASRGSVCGPCHPVHDPLGAASWPKAGGGGDRSAADLADFCGSCHRPDGLAASAVVGERAHPAAASATLGAKGSKAVGCAGCHDPHRWNPADPRDRGKSAGADPGAMFLLRSAAGPADLCTGCHAEQAAIAGSKHDLSALARSGALGSGLPDPAGRGVCSVCHRVHGGDPLSRGPGGADPCTACHAKGRLAAGAVVGAGGHPVGVSPGQDIGPDLPLYAATGRRQPGGRIGCGTCHDAHRWEPAGGSGGTSPAATSFLRLGADGYAPLCFPCHAERSMVVGTDHDLRVTAPRALNRAGETAEASGVCGACHAVHAEGARLVGWNRELGEGTDARSRTCTGCHRAGNAMGARVPPRAEVHRTNYPGRGEVSRLFTVTRSAIGAGAGAIALFREDGAAAEQGFLSCVSCHDVHRWEPDVSRSGAGAALEGDITNSFLKVRSTLAVERTLCAECHGADALEKFRAYHFPSGR